MQRTLLFLFPSLAARDPQQTASNGEIIAIMRESLAHERNAALAGSWTYSFPRHSQMWRAFERAREHASGNVSLYALELVQ